MITDAYGVTVRDLLALPCLQGTTVLAGHAGLDRTVGGVNVMEVPDIVDWVKPRELLVTTGFPLTSPAGDDRPAVALPELVHQLHERDLAGLGVKIGRYLDHVDPAAVAAADERDLPLLALPGDLAFDELLQQAYARLGELTAGVLQRIDALHHALTLVVLEGGNLDQIAAEVSRVLGLGVLVTSTDGREWAAALSAEQRDRLVAADLLEPGGRFRVERASTRPVPLGDGEVRLQPIVAGGADLARLVLVREQGPLSHDDVSAVERAATVAALLVTREEAVAAVENKYRGDFLRDVFLGRAGDRAYVVEHAAGLGWDLERPLRVVTAELDPAPEDEAPSGRVHRAWQERFAAAWRQVCEGRDPGVPTVDFTAEVVALVPATAEGDDDRAPGADRPAADAALVDTLVTAVRGDQGGGRRPFSVGVSRRVTSPEELPDAYTQARRATEVGRRIHGGNGTSWFDDLGVHRLVALVPDPGEVRAFAHDVLGPLAEETAEAAELRTTLQTLLDTNLNVAEAARAQFFHYNTMRYRVTKLERLLGPFTTDPHLRLDVAVALQVLQLRD